jgi:hypothetical protein
MCSRGMHLVPPEYTCHAERGLRFAFAKRYRSRSIPTRSPAAGCPTLNAAGRPRPRRASIAKCFEGARLQPCRNRTTLIAALAAGWPILNAALFAALGWDFHRRSLLRLAIRDRLNRFRLYMPSLLVPPLAAGGSGRTPPDFARHLIRATRTTNVGATVEERPFRAANICRINSGFSPGGRLDQPSSPAEVPAHVH